MGRMLVVSIRPIAVHIARPCVNGGYGSERRIQLAVGGVGLVVVRHVVPQDVWGVRIGAVGDERVGVGAGDGCSRNRRSGCSRSHRERRFQSRGAQCTNPQVPDLGYYESNSGIHSAGDTTLGSLDLPF